MRPIFGPNEIQQAIDEDKYLVDLVDLNVDGEFSPINLYQLWPRAFKELVVDEYSPERDLVKVYLAKARDPDRVLSVRMPYRERPPSWIEFRSLVGGWTINGLGDAKWNKTETDTEQEARAVEPYPARITFHLQDTVYGRLALATIRLSASGPGSLRFAANNDKWTTLNLPSTSIVSRSIDILYREGGTREGDSPVKDFINLDVMNLRNFVFKEFEYRIL